MGLTKVRLGGIEPQNLGRRNLIINGGMQVAQRGTSSTGLGATAGYFTVDRFKMHFAGSTAGRLTMEQSTDTPEGFANSVKLSCTTADTSIASGEQLQLRTTLEGQDLQQLKKGTSNAEKVTVSFYVKGNASATYTCELYDNDNTRHNGQEFSVTTSWNRVVLTFVGDTTGTLDNDNGGSLNLTFLLHAGSDLSGGTFSSNTWSSTNNERLGTNQTSFFDSTDRTFFITGVQMEIGEVATPFEHRSFGEEQALCQRYFQQWTQEASGFSTNNYAAVCDAVMHSSTLPFMQYVHPTVLRATPSLTFNGSFAANISGSDYGMSSFTPNTRTPYVTSFYASTGSAGAGKAGFMRAHNDGDASIFFDSEL